MDADDLDTKLNIQLQVLPDEIKRALVKECERDNRSMNDALLLIVGREFGVPVELSGRPFMGALTGRNTLFRRLPRALYRQIGHLAVDGRCGYSDRGTDEREVVVDTLRRHFARKKATAAA